MTDTVDRPDAWQPEDVDAEPRDERPNAGASGQGGEAQAEGPPATEGPEGLSELAFDAALDQLQQVVGRLESGGLPLEESIALYERGVALHEHCARLLADADLRVQRLVEQAGGALRTIDLSPDDEA